MSEANVQSTGTLLFDNTPKPMTEDHRSEGIIQDQRSITICHLILTETPDTQQTSTTPKQTQTIKTHPNTKTLVYYENTL